MENGRCRIHGGKSPKGADSATYKSGLYSRFVSADIQEKIDLFADSNPLDLSEELSLTRALLASFVERYKNTMQPDGEGIALMLELIEKIRRVVDTISKIKNDTALTTAEVMFLAARFAQLIDETTDDPHKREAIKQKLFALVSGTGEPILAGNVNP